mgnify:CR=1 FL=1
MRKSAVLVFARQVSEKHGGEVALRGVDIKRCVAEGAERMRRMGTDLRREVLRPRFAGSCDAYKVQVGLLGSDCFVNGGGMQTSQDETTLGTAARDRGPGDARAGR